MSFKVNKSCELWLSSLFSWFGFSDFLCKFKLQLLNVPSKTYVNSICVKNTYKSIVPKSPQSLTTLTWPSSSGSPSTCPVNTPKQMRMELNWPMNPRICLGVISPKYIGSTLRAMPIWKKMALHSCIGSCYGKDQRQIHVKCDMHM